MIQNVIKQLFSVQGGKAQKVYRFLGIKIKRRNYTYMIRKLYQWQHFEKLKSTFEQQGIILPPETENLFDDAEIATVALKDIRRKWRGKTYTLDEVSPYKYLQTRDKRIYEEYVRKNYREFNGLVPEDIDTSPTRFEALEQSINKNGYDPSKCVIVLDKNNIIIDGQHRSCILYYKYGGDFTIKVVREK